MHGGGGVGEGGRIQFYSKERAGGAKFIKTAKETGNEVFVAFGKKTFSEIYPTDKHVDRGEKQEEERRFGQKISKEEREEEDRQTRLIHFSTRHRDASGACSTYKIIIRRKKSCCARTYPGCEKSQN